MYVWYGITGGAWFDSITKHDLHGRFKPCQTSVFKEYYERCGIDEDEGHVYCVAD